ncbi:hypothetical protein C7I87_21030 [Mesorhizobium sp. SARCC-RB16n]|nr:hypothetical protein C7I87_21030 [Mesorhizobium sp. SARCC-RB16n]
MPSLDQPACQCHQDDPASGCTGGGSTGAAEFSFMAFSWGHCGMVNSFGNNPSPRFAAWT